MEIAPCPRSGGIAVGQLGAIRPELLQCRTSHRTEQTPPRQPKHGISDTPRTERRIGLVGPVFGLSESDPASFDGLVVLDVVGRTSPVPREPQGGGIALHVPLCSSQKVVEYLESADRHSHEDVGTTYGKVVVMQLGHCSTVLSVQPFFCSRMNGSSRSGAVAGAAALRISLRRAAASVAAFPAKCASRSGDGRQKWPAAARHTVAWPGGGGPKAGIPSGARCSCRRWTPLHREYGEPPPGARGLLARWGVSGLRRPAALAVSRTWSRRSRGRSCTRRA